MKYLVSGKEMKQYDENTTLFFGMSGNILMERAALAVAEAAEECGKRNGRVLVAAGTGNNGGDGLAAGRILKQRGYQVTFWMCAGTDGCSEQTQEQLEIIKNYGWSIESNLPASEYDIIIDAILGIGLNREVIGPCKDAVERIGRMEGIKIAVDIPSGVGADDGKVYGVCVKADITVTFGFMKIGLLWFPGAASCGRILLRDIGITEESFGGVIPKLCYYNQRDLSRLPYRRVDGNKGTFGKVLLIAGSREMSGAGQLAALAAFRAGAGMVRVFTPEENRELMQKAIPEVLVTAYDSNNFRQKLREAMEWASVIAIGPGMGVSEAAVSITELVLSANKPLVMDADALNCLAQDRRLLRKLVGKDVVLTPHVGEFSRLCGREVLELKERLISEVLDFAKEYQITLVCKDARTIVSSRGTENYLNMSGNEGMATAGSGDVLTGIIAAFTAQGVPLPEAARLGVYVHGLAGDLAKKKSNSYYIMANDCIEQLKYVLKEQENDSL